jgi:uncharacterized membrane protein YphA (DoxX/SURF4 family)
MESLTSFEPISTQATAPAWPLIGRIGFRFAIVYFTLFCLSNQIINTVFAVPTVDVPDWSTLPPFRQIVFWVAGHVLGMKLPLVYSGSGSGDKNWDWALLFCFFITAVLATLLWSILDRKRLAYPVLHKWFLLFLRICLGGQMLLYGASKIIPLQMSGPFLTQLIEPYGNQSPASVLWNSIGASPAYEICTGAAEVLGGLLLIFPRTATLGALICLADMTEVFLLNMTYDVPVKILSFHLILISLLLLQPEFSRLTRFFLLNRPVEPARRPQLFQSRRARLVTSGIVGFLWLWMIGNLAYSDWDGWHQYGPGRPKSPLYGIWNIEKLTLDGTDRPRLATDSKAWRRIVFDAPSRMSVQQMDDSTQAYNAAIDTQAGTLNLSRAGDKNWKASFAFTRPAPDRLVLNGIFNGSKAELDLALLDPTKMMLRSRGFHWVQDYPFYR